MRPDVRRIHIDKIECSNPKHQATSTASKAKQLHHWTPRMFKLAAAHIKCSLSSATTRAVIADTFYIQTAAFFQRGLDANHHLCKNAHAQLII
jgi:hypothetical protein